MPNWIDVDVSDWYYRYVADADRTYLDKEKKRTLFSGIVYNVFEVGKERKVVNYVTTSNQDTFDFPNYTPSTNNKIIVYVDGVRIENAEYQNGKVYLANALSGGLDVTIVAVGVPLLGSNGRPQLVGTSKYPTAQLSKGNSYVNLLGQKTSSVEYCVVLDKKLKRVNPPTRFSEIHEGLLEGNIGYRDDVYTVYKGRLYVPFIYNNAVVKFGYHFVEGGVRKFKEDKLTPVSTSIPYNDRFFPNLEILRYEFFILLSRLRENLYNRYTDSNFELIRTNLRGVLEFSNGFPDTSFRTSWYASQILDLLNEKYLDGCYVFPLYEDGSFDPNGKITRAEAVTYISRFMEWAIEKFR
jgi:hypothetical protein